MGDRGHNRHGPKRGGLLHVPLSREPGPRLVQCGLAEVYFRTKRRLHPYSHLVTIDMGKKLGGDGCAFSGGSWVHIEHNVA